MLLHIPLTMAEGFRVGSTTTSTCSAPLGSSSPSSVNKDFDTGGGGGGGGGVVSGGEDVVLFKIRPLLLPLLILSSVLLLFFWSPANSFGGDECRTSSFVFLISSAELRRECGADETDSCGKMRIIVLIKMLVFI